MTRKEYDAMTLKQAQALRFRTLATIRTANMEIPKGSLVRVVAKRDGWTVSTDHCKHCGVSGYARKVPPSHLEVVP